MGETGIYIDLILTNIAPWGNIGTRKNGHDAFRNAWTERSRLAKWARGHGIDMANEMSERSRLLGLG